MHAVLDSIGAHPHGALLIVTLVAFAESLAIVGTVVPAAIVMFAAGALVGNGSLDVWATLASAVFGAVLGDGLSYELGRAHEARIRAWPTFRRHGAAIERGEGFLRRHGGKSVVLARFTGAVRAFVPLLAGFAHMPRVRFYAVNLGSALLWAPAHILPGVLFGASLQMAEAVSGRLAAIVLLLVFVVWIVVWLVSATLRFVVPQVRRLRDAAVLRARPRHSWVARATLALLDPQRPGSHALLLGTMVLLGAGWLFFGVLEDVLSHDPLVQADAAVLQFLQGLRSASIDRWMIVITEMGSVGVLLPLVVVVLAWLVWRRCWRTAAYWVGVAAFGEVLVQVLKFTLGRHRPLDIYTGVERFSFPSGHATVSTVVLAFLAFLLSHGQVWRLRLGIAAVAGVYVALVAFSRLYLGAHWFSDVLGGMSLGLTWVAFVSMVYTQRQVRENIAARGLMLVVVASLGVSGAVWSHWRSAADLSRYSVTPPRQFMSATKWLADGWRELPARRLELAGDTEEPIQLQWACRESDVATELKADGWQEPPGWSWTSALGSIAAHTSLGSLPVLPKFNQGDPSRLVFIRWSPLQPDEREVLRLWRSEFELTGPAAQPLPIWYGTFYHETRRTRGGVAANLLRQSVLPFGEVTALLPKRDRREIHSHKSSGMQVVLMLCNGARP